MARGIGRLTGADLRRKKPGMRCDGGGLWIQITEAKDGSANRSWVLRYTINGVRHHMGLGSLNTVGLKEARDRARAARLLVLDGVDPITRRDQDRAARIVESAKSLTFAQCAAAYIAAHRNEWRNQQHAAQWPSSLRKHVYPKIGSLPVAAIDTAVIVNVLEPIWTDIPETASRLRGRIESVLDWATVTGLRQGDNPARWQGHLKHLLAKPRNGHDKHHAALPWREVPAFMAKLRAVDGTIARALEFAILTAARRQEVRGATWGEIDPDLGIWTIPDSRMKGGREHRVPLSPRCVSILREAESIRTGDLVFAGPRTGEQFATKNFSDLLRRLGHGDITPHGFRSSFRDWAGESTNYPREICEAALAHAIENKSEAAYRRGDALDKRRRMMDAWAKFCAEPGRARGEVISIGA
jgi:integrase